MGELEDQLETESILKEALKLFHTEAGHGECRGEYKFPPVPSFERQQAHLSSHLSTFLPSHQSPAPLLSMGGTHPNSLTLGKIQ